MILTCPACATQYRLKDDAIPPEGRQVRCAACKHKWHEDGAGAPLADSGDAATPWPVAEPRVTMDDGVGVAPPPPDTEHVEEIVATVPEDAAREQMIAENPMPEVPREDDWTRQDPEPEAPVAAQWGAAAEPYPPEDHGFAAIPAMHDDDEERGSWLGWIIGVIVVVIAAAAAFYYLAPAEYKARAGIAEVGESQLELMLTTSDRQKLASGNELLAISGRVINSTDQVLAVPPIQAELRDPADNRLVYHWTIAPPARSLQPGAAASFNSAELDVPKGGVLSLSLRFAG